MTLLDIADAVWTYVTRTLDGLVPAAPTDALDDIAYEVWVYDPRTLTGAAVNTVISENLLAPSQAAVCTVGMAVAIAEDAPAPVQALTASTASVVSTVIAEDLMAPAQSIVAEAHGGVVPVPVTPGLGAWEYYPPKFPVRTRIHETTLAPRQHANVLYFVPVKPIVHVVRIKPVVRVSVVHEVGLAPSQQVLVKRRRSVRMHDDEDKLIMLLLGAA